LSRKNLKEMRIQMKCNQKVLIILASFFTQTVVAETPPIPSSKTSINPTAGPIIAAAQPTDSGLSAVSQAGIPTGVPARKTFKDKLGISYYGVYSGPSLGFQNDYNPTYDGKEGDVQNLDSLITASYKITSKFQAGVAFPVLYIPYGDSETILNNVFVRVSRSELIKSARFKMSLASRFYLPTNQDSRDAGFKTGIRVEQNSTYDLKRLPITLGLYTYERQYYYDSKAPSRSILTLYAAPYVNYQFTSKVGATLWVDLIQLKQPQGKSVSKMENAPVGVQPGVNWDVNDKVSLNPYINLYPGYLSADSSSLGLIISAKVL